MDRCELRLYTPTSEQTECNIYFIRISFHINYLRHKYQLMKTHFIVTHLIIQNFYCSFLAKT